MIPAHGPPAGRSSIALSKRTLNRLAGLLRSHRHEDRSHWRRLKLGQSARWANAPVATLQVWRLLIMLRCCPRPATAIVRVILALHHVENPVPGS